MKLDAGVHLFWVSARVAKGSFDLGLRKARVTAERLEGIGIVREVFRPHDYLPDVGSTN